MKYFKMNKDHVEVNPMLDEIADQSEFQARARGSSGRGRDRASTRALALGALEAKGTHAGRRTTSTAKSEQILLRPITRDDMMPLWNAGFSIWTSGHGGIKGIRATIPAAT